ncbi:Pickpocket protein 19, partial [Pseudolycoriella hygida]
DFRFKQNIKEVSIPVATNGFAVSRSSKVLKLDTLKINGSVWGRYCTSSTVHGIRYLAEPNVKVTERFLNDASNETVNKLRDIIIGLNSFEFSSFEEFELIIQNDLSDLDHINMTELYLRANESDYPWRTTKFGDWSGIRAHIRINDSTKIPHIKRRSGVLLMAQNPFSWPISSYFLPAATSASVQMTPTLSYASKGVLSLQPSERNCLVPDEVHKSKYETLPGTQYFFTNCICNCRMHYLISTCNCTVDFLYPSADYQQCKLTDLKCLFDNNDLFNHEKPSTENQYFSDKEDGMVCDCLPECESVDYELDVTPSKGSDDDDMDNRIILDVHFDQSTMFKYRTDVVFDWLDLMVGFGGIAGLFLGISLMSIAEIFFYLGIGTMAIIRDLIELYRKKK